MPRDSRGRFVQNTSGRGGHVELKFNLRIKEVYREIFKNTEAEIARWGVDAVDIAKRLAPVDTGELKGDIHIEEGKVTKYIVGKMLISGPKRSGAAPHSYGAHVEFGTVENPAQPHMIPAVRIAKRNAVGNMRQRKLTGR